MKICAFILGFWNSREEAKDKSVGQFGYESCITRLNNCLHPGHVFIACGTWSHPAFNELDFVPTVNSGQPNVGGYDGFYNQYSGCAFTAAMAYALNRQDWDMLATLDTDALVGTVNFKTLLDEFEKRSEVLLSPAWGVTPGGPFHVFKREGAAMFLHRRLRANIVDPSEPKPMLIENELAQIYRGRWWNPWPNLPSMRQDYGYIHDPNPRRALAWPFVRFPDPSIIDEYLATQTTKAIPYE